MENSPDRYLEGLYREASPKIQDRYQEFSRLMRAVLDEVCKARSAIRIGNDSIIERIAGCLYARMTETLMPIPMLLEYGLPSQARILLRTTLETVFTLGAILRKPNMADRLLEAQEYERQRIARNLVKIEQAGDIAQMMEQQPELVDELLLSNPKSVNTWELAQAAGMSDWYLTVYMETSWATHTSLMDLEAHLITKNGEISGFRAGPTGMDQEKIWLAAIDIATIATRFLAEVFPVIDVSPLDELTARSHELWDRLT